MPEKTRVFISSTFKDLEPQREALRLALPKMHDVQPVVMEDFTADSASTHGVSLMGVDNSDMYVGIVAGRYGSGITEQEYDRARERRLPCLIFMARETLEQVAAADDAARLDREKLAKFKKKLRERHTVENFDDPSSLVLRVVLALHNKLIEQRGFHRIVGTPDWAAAPHTPDAVRQVLEFDAHAPNVFLDHVISRVRSDGPCPSLLELTAWLAALDVLARRSLRRALDRGEHNLPAAVLRLEHWGGQLRRLRRRVVRESLRDLQHERASVHTFVESTLWPLVTRAWLPLLWWEGERDVAEWLIIRSIWREPGIGKYELERICAAGLSRGALPSFRTLLGDRLTDATASSALTYLDAARAALRWQSGEEDALPETMVIVTPQDTEWSSNHAVDAILLPTDGLGGSTPEEDWLRDTRAAVRHLFGDTVASSVDGPVVLGDYPGGGALPWRTGLPVGGLSVSAAMAALLTGYHLSDNTLALAQLNHSGQLSSPTVWRGAAQQDALTELGRVLGQLAAETSATPLRLMFANDCEVAHVRAGAQTTNAIPALDTIQNADLGDALGSLLTASPCGQASTVAKVEADAPVPDASLRAAAQHMLTNSDQRRWLFVVDAGTPLSKGEREDHLARELAAANSTFAINVFPTSLVVRAERLLNVFRDDRKASVTDVILQQLPMRDNTSALSATRHSARAALVRRSLSSGRLALVISGLDTLPLESARFVLSRMPKQQVAFCAAFWNNTLGDSPHEQAAVKSADFSFISLSWLSHAADCSSEPIQAESTIALSQTLAAYPSANREPRMSGSATHPRKMHPGKFDD